MKTIESRVIRHSHYLTADDAPVFECAPAWLDRVQRYCGGIRGYGGPIDGHWLKLTRSQYENYVVRVKYAEDLGVPFP